MDRRVKEQILAVRATGRTNMFDVNMVMRIAYDSGFYELVNYLQDRQNQRKYANFILRGDEQE